jgi:hypothetical protein
MSAALHALELEERRRGRQFERPWAPADPAATRLVDCGSCHACCHQLVTLAAGEDPARYEVDTIAAPGGPIHLLRRTADGACIYLGAAGCTIWGRHPEICRHFDCGLWFKTTRRPQRQLIKRAGDDNDRRMLAEGRRRAASADG